MIQMRRSMKSSLDPIDQGFGQRLRAARQGRGWTQYQLAENIDVERSVIANYEQGISFPPVPALRRLATALSISVDQLIFEAVALEECIQDRNLLEIFTKVDSLDYRAKDMVKEFIEGLLAKRELERLKTGTDQ